MIQTGFESRVKIQDIIANQLPDFILDESPKTVDFLKQYYISQEYQGGPVDIAENLDQYIKLDNLTPEVVVGSTTLVSAIDSDDDIINVSSTKGFPNQYGLLKIDDEIISYTGLTTNTFTGCIRGFSGITSYHSDLNQEELVFTQSVSAAHDANSKIQNLSSLFLKEFYKKLKYTFAPGFEERVFDSNLNVGNFIKEARSFYESKGTDESFRILFNVLYGETPKIINLEDQLIKPSDAEFIRREIVISEAISGNPLKLVGQTIFKTNDTSTKASISSVEPFTRKGIQYFKISLFVGYEDNTSIEGTFTITPSTKCLETVEVGSSIISVDSTIGFDKSGTIRSGNNLISYTDKSVNQFLNCSGITEQILPTDNIISTTGTYFGYEDGDLSKKVELRLTGVLSNFVQKSEFVSVDEGQILTVKHLGDNIKNPEQNKTYKEIFANSWIYNTSSSIQIESISGSTVVLRTTVDRSQLKKGDLIEIIDNSTNQVVYPTLITDIPYVDTEISVNSTTISLSNFNFVSDSEKTYSLRRKLNKSKSTSVPFKYGNNTVISDVQNLYTDGNYAYVASNSLPSYGNGFTNFYNYELTKSLNQANITPGSGSLIDQDPSTNLYTTISFDNPVPFVTGERIFYEPASSPLVGLETGSYYVEVLSNPKNIKLYTSSSFVGDDDNSLRFSSPISGIGTHKFTLYSQKSQQIDSSKILKKFSLSPNIKSGVSEKTIPGSTGMLINGVEIYNYKTYNKIYYGPIESVQVLNGGKGYDVINPPKIEVSSSSGTTALIQPVLSGTITDIFVDSQNFNIDQVLSLNVTGGNIVGGKFEPVLVRRRREVFFDGRPTSNGGGISTTTSQLTFLSDHNLSNGEEIIYRNNGNSNISIGIGLSSLIDNSSYYVKVDNNQTIKLFNNFEDYSSGINTIGFASTSLSGIHKFLVGDIQNTISEIKIINGGTLINKKLLVKPSGISTANHTVIFNNHGFLNGDIIEYSSVVGLGSTQPQTIVGLTTTNQYYVLKVNNDSFRLCDAGIGGTISSNFNEKNIVKFSTQGTGYQQFKYPDIQVSIEFSSVGVGTTTQTQNIIATPVVKGSIVDLQLYEAGSGYGSSVLNVERKPTFTIKTGKEGQVEPIIVNGQVSDVNLQFGGFEYFSNPELKVVDPTGSGTGAKLRSIISNGKIIDVKIIQPGIGYSTSSRIDVVPSGSGAIFDSSIRSLTINEVEKISPKQYEIFRDNDNQLQYFVSGYYEDLRNSFQENESVLSKIIGWAYDGNPIYGSYGLIDPNDINSGIKTLASGYTKNSSNVEDRPSLSDFPLGFFVEDYKYDGNGDLDKNNGRFSKTPDFPNGVYAYYATIDSATGSPTFPYFIGDSFRSNTLEENQTLNQEFDFNNSDLIRNTFPYKISESFADNDFIIETNEIKRQKISIESVSEGPINGFDIINPGDNYKVGDKLTFDNLDTNGGGIDARVSAIKGRVINEINTTLETFNNAIFTWDENRVKVTILPYHTLLNNDYVTISGFSTSNLSKLNNTFKITSNNNLSVGLTTAIVASGAASTEIYVSNIPTGVSAGSTIGIGTETLQVLNVFKNNNILRVQRGLPGTSHEVGSLVSLKNNSFTIDAKLDYFKSEVNKKVYFNPRKSIGVGTISGISSDVSFNFGNQIIYRSIPTQRIYIEDHPFSTNQLVTLNTNGNSTISISTSPSGTPFNIPSTLYVVNKSPNTIGVKTSLTSNEVFFRTNGDNSDDYLFETNFEQKLATVKKIKSTVSVSTSHGLTEGDTITLNVKPNLTVGIGTSSSVKILRNLISNYLEVNPVGFNSLGVSTTTNQIQILNHEFKTGDKVRYSGNEIISGLSTDFYFVYKVDSNNISLCETYVNSLLNPPTTVSFASTGGSSQILSLINPQIKSVKNNNLVFDLSDSSLSGYVFKIYYDQEFSNEFVSTGSTNNFSISGVGTVGVSPNASLTINYDSEIPEKLYYSLEKSGYICTSDSDVKDYSEILFTKSQYNTNYTISGVGTTTFSINLTSAPEKLSYTKSECDTLEYTTTSTSAKGPVNKINLVSGGEGYKKEPNITGSNSEEGENLYLIPRSKSIGNVKEVRIINPGFEYSSDKTLSPQAFISPKITLKDSNTVGIVTVIDGGKNFVSAPQIVVVNKDTREVVDNGLLKSVLNGNSISNVLIEVSPKGISDESAELFTVNNTNGISIREVKSSATGIFTCVLTTPISGFSIDPFAVGDEVFIEGIQKYSSAGDGFNSADYGYKFFKVSKYENKFTPGLINDQVTINVSGLTTNTGIAKTIQDASGTIVPKDDYPVFDITIKPSEFEVGEKLISNNIERDLEVVKYDDSASIKVFGSYDLSKGEVITGKSSGNVATIGDLIPFEGKFDVSFSTRKNEGWNNENGKLNTDYQVISDNDYYQNLSYSIKNTQQWKDIRTPVNSLVHPVGLKNFSDTQIISDSDENIGLTESFNETTIIKDFFDEKRVDTIYNFDFVKDIDVIGSKSKFLKLKNNKLTDYVEVGSNIVLKIDDISDQFSSSESEQNTYTDVFEIDTSESYSTYLFKVSDINNTEIQLTNLTIVNDDINENSFILEKQSLSNVGTGLTHIDDEEYGVFSIESDSFGTNYLRFTPKDPFNTEYNLKYIKKKFITGVGVGKSFVGFIDLTSNAEEIITGSESTLVELDASTISSLYVTNQVIQENTNKINFVELYVTHDGTNTNIVEYYFDTTPFNRSSEPIGIFTSFIDSGNISIKYINDTSFDTTIKSRVVGFGSTSLGIGTHRFKLNGQPAGNERSAIYQSNFSETSSGLSTSVISLNKNIFDSVKSLVEVSIGSTKSIHQVLLVHDNSNIYSQQSAFLSIGSTSGIGTFGGEYSGSNFSLKFYPDAGITDNIKILSFNECLYTEVDFINDAPDLQFGTSVESVETSQYFALNGNRVNKKNFVLRNGGVPIFAKKFDPSNTDILNSSTGTFTIENHFFSENEELIYTPKSTFVGVGSTPMVYKNGSISDALPSSVFVVNKTDNTFQISTTRAGSAVTFTSLGEGNAHQFEMSKKNEKSLITIDNVAQYPLIYTKIETTLSGNGGGISTDATTFSLSGISTLNPLNILKVGDEYMEVINVGFGTTNIGPITNTGTETLVQVDRGFVGSSATSHSDGDTVQVYKGSYNIIGDEIFFTKSPRGNVFITRTENNLKFETSEFTGRVFLRKTYDSNQIYDDISNEFTGVGRTFTLTVGGANTIGIGTTGGNGIVFLNGIFQTPTTVNNPNNNFSIIEDTIAGISSIAFSGIRTDITDPNSILVSESDVNQNEIPRGGIIVSLGSSGGIGYAPLAGASVTAILNGGGSIVGLTTGITGGTFGSGYNGIVSIGVSVYESDHTGNVASIGATVGVGGTLIFTINDGGTGYTNPEIFVSEPSYENLEVIGVSRIGIGATTDSGIGLLIDIEVGASSTTGIGSTYFEVSNFSISRSGYSFRKGDVFKPVGLVTDGRLSSPISEFQLTVLETFSDNFGAWQFGEFDFIDSIVNYQDGSRVRFPLFYNGSLLSFEKQNSSNLDLSNLILVVMNGVIQDPGVAYVFEGGTSFTFTTAPKPEDDIAIFFYRGTRGEDDLLVTNILPTLEKGDDVQVFRNDNIPDTITQDKRVIFDLSFSDKFETNLYSDQGVDEINDKPMSWTKQKTDRVINGDLVYKTRESIISQVYPTAKIIGNVSDSDTRLFVDDPDLFTYNLSAPYTFSGILVDEKQLSSANITASIGVGGTISSLTILNGGNGYTGSTVEVKFESPLVIGAGVGTTASATVTVGSGGSLTTPINIINPGFGYTTNPKVIVSSPNQNIENIIKIESIKGFSGIITGITATTNSGQLALKFNLKRNTTFGNDLEVGYPILIKNTHVGFGVTSVDSGDSAVVGIGTTFLDNIYYVHQITTDGVNGIVTCNIDSGTITSGIDTSGDFVGEFSWGLMTTITRSSSPISIGVTGKTVNIGLTTFPTIQRRNEGLRQNGSLPEKLD